MLNEPPDTVLIRKKKTAGKNSARLLIPAFGKFVVIQLVIECHRHQKIGGSFIYLMQQGAVPFARRGRGQADKGVTMRQKNIRILSVRPRAARLTFFRCGEEGRDTSFSTLLDGEALALSLRIAGGTGAFQSYIEVRFQEGGGFTFKPEDALPGAPVFSSRLGIAVTDGDDRRDYAAVAAAQKARGLLTRVERAEGRWRWTRAPVLPFSRCPATPGSLRSGSAAIRSRKNSTWSCTTT